MGDAGIDALPPLNHEPAGLPSTNPTLSFWQTAHPNRIAHHRSTHALPSRAITVIVGTGITGSFAAHELVHLLPSSAHARLRKQEVGDHAQPHSSSAENSPFETLHPDILVLDARTTCSAATGRNGGHLQPLIHSASQDTLDFEMQNFHHIEELIEGHGIECDFRRVHGCLAFWNREFFREAKDALRADLSPRHDAPSAPVGPYVDLVKVVEDPADLAALGLVDAVGAMVQEVAASLSPYKLIIGMWETMLTEFDTSRLNLQTNTAVTTLEQTPRALDDSREGINANIDNAHADDNHQWLVHTPRGTVRADTVILATNGYTSHLLPEFSALISPVQAQMSALVPPRASKFLHDLIPMSYGFMGVEGQDRIMSDYLVQNPILSDRSGEAGMELEHGGGGGHLMFGGGRQCAAGHGVGVSDDNYVDTDTERYLRRLPQHLNMYDAPALDTTIPPTRTTHTESPVHAHDTLDIAASWTGIIGSSADHHPWVGPVPEKDGLFLCAGYTGHGMTNAGLCGRYAARLAATWHHGKEAWTQGHATVETNIPALSTTHGVGGNRAWTIPRAYLLTKERMESALRQ